MGPALVLVLGLLSLAPAAAQAPTGTLRGVVTDETGAFIPGVSIDLTHPGSNRTFTSATSAYGDYLFLGLEAGSYSMSLDLPGFEIGERVDVRIAAGQVLDLDLRLEFSALGTTIDVIEAVPSIRPFGPAVVGRLSGEDLARLPNDRSILSLARTATGVNPGVLGGGLEIGGATSAENLFLIDGVPTGSPIDGRSRQSLPPEFLELVEVATSGIAAEQTGATGGLIALTTRSGGNGFHGDVHLYYAGAPLSALPVRRLVLDPVDDTTVGFVQDPEDSHRRLEGGFSLGGPIRRDRLFFFTSWSPTKSRRERAYLLENGTTPATFRGDQTRMAGLTKLTFEPSRRLRSNVSMLWTPTRSEGTLAAPNGPGPNHDSRSPSSLESNRERGFDQPQSLLRADLGFDLSRNLILGARGSYVHDNYLDRGIPGVSSVEYRTSAVGLAGVPPELQQGVGFNNTPRALETRHDRTSRASGEIDLVLSADRGGFHSLQAGFGIEKTVNNVDAAFPGGGYVFVFWDTTFAGSPTGVEDRGPFGYYEVHDTGTRGSAGSLFRSVYFQDHWQVRSDLTLSLGVRAEHESIPSFRPDSLDRTLETVFGWKQRVAPRIGASWDAMGNGRLRVYGSFGRYYDRNKYDWARRSLGGAFWTVRYRSLETPDVFALSGTNTPGRDLWIPSVPDSFRDLGGFSFLTGVDPEIRPMATNQYVAGAGYRWNTQTDIGVRYLGSRLVRTIEDFARIALGNAVFTYGNPGSGRATTVENPSTATEPFPFPKATRRYDALELTLRRTFADNWFADLAYTWSRLEGNYPGTGNVDEVWTPTLGFGFPTSQQQDASVARPGGNTSLAFDLDEVLFDAHGNLDPTGPLPTDRPHVVRFSGGYERPWAGLGTTGIAAFFFAGSGTPLSTRVNTANRLPVFVNGRGDLGRTPVLSYTDLNLTHTIPVTEGQRLRIELTMLNVFDQKTTLHRFEHLNRGAGGSRDSSAIDLSGVDLFEGYDYEALITASPDGADAFDPRYGMDDLFRSGFEGRLGVRYEF